ncbi:rhomboid family intramembrane serine protease [Flavobacterium sp.]|jgi:membrane associated rhomboid family serine protease|uniref:rhomboid family intramembrane serine protease n=1 Tax=Flavobacterium sp. TaxID=239 RepID=UPI0022C2DEED|nr:rhomboid family intramembrane serine protease [Flavobacterium sp.]MCZ8227975.1 rhomboid family intramembrane serine protease [Flavobacterium sp.]
MEENHFQFRNRVVLLPLLFLLTIWLVYWLEVRFHFDFDKNGIYPRTFSGLQGVLFSPFIHSDLLHLYNNSLPLLVLLTALSYFYPKQTLTVLCFGIVLSGVITWVIGRPNYHIGASGLIYVLVSFIFFKGIQTQYYRLVALSLTVVLVYGGLIWYVFPEVDNTISWEGHLAGFITGFLLSIVFKAEEYQKIYKYEWERPDYDPSQDKFMQRFDENGNFVNPPKQEIEEEVDPIMTYFTSNLPIHYDCVPTQKKEPKQES